MNDINEFIHKNMGLNPKRLSAGVRRDIFLQYIPSNIPKDNLVLRNLSDLSNVCFKRCVDPNYEHYTYEEEKCVKNCVADYFEGFQTIVVDTQKRFEASE